ncbi:MAG: sulfatase-like hydrolase/transferase [Rhizomicrobium sp.]
MAAAKKPNILFIMADDIGWFNISCNNNGIMGYRTPNIDRIAKEGANFTDFYAQQSCTAGRAAFITGQSPIPHRPHQGRNARRDTRPLGGRPIDRTVSQGLRLRHGQFGKNHLGDRNEHLPTVHGFDEFFGNLYHPECRGGAGICRLSERSDFRKKFGPRGVLKCRASDKDDATVDAQFGRVGRQVIENTGALTRKRMETVDEEFVGAALDFMERKTKDGAPWFCYVNTTRMHVFTHLKQESVGKTGHGLYPDGMVELDGYVGELLDKLEELGVADNTIVVFTTDNGAEVLSWPDGGATPFRGEKDTNWRVAGARLVSCAGRALSRRAASSTISPRCRISSPHSRRRPANPISSTRSGKAMRSETGRSRSISMATIWCRSCPARKSNRRARASSIGATTAT